MTRALLVVLLLMTGAPVMAGTGVGQSTWNRGQAIKRAIKNKPAGAVITKRHCNVINAQRNTYWTCFVNWD